MPQPKKPASSARRPSARKPAARKPAAAKPGRKGPAPKQAPHAAPSAASAASNQQASDAKRREDQLPAAIASLRELLTKGVVITGDRLQETVDEAVRRGRMTRQDAEDLVQNLVQIGRRQSQDALAEIEDRALRTVDRVRRAARRGHAFPIVGYDDLTAAQAKERLADLSPAELRKVRDHERRNANRKSVLTAIERRLQ